MGESLNDVSCTADDFCAAVGSLGDALNLLSETEEWNGSDWTAGIDPAALLDFPTLEGVSCVASSFCMAVGEYEDDTSFNSDTLIESWNGATWAIVPSPDGALASSELTAISCTSTTFCMAVGNSTTPDSPNGQTLTEVWNGSTWSSVPSPNGAGMSSALISVSCVGGSFCISLGDTPSLVGNGVESLQLAWDGSSWSISNASATPAPIGTVSCVAGNFCMAAAQSTYEQWDGVSWSIIPNSATSDNDVVKGLTCVSVSFCLSVGSRDGHQTGYETQSLLKQWNGSTWTYVPTADATSASNNEFSGVSCSMSACFAVGSYASPADGVLSGLIETSPLSNGGSAPGPATAPIVGMTATPDGNGYWLVGSDGSVLNYGDALFYGSMQGTHLNKPIVGMAVTPDGGGYWLVASDGGIFAFGDAKFYGSTGSLHLNQPVVGMTSTPDGGGYWFVASDGGIFAFGDATFYGSMGAQHLNEPVVGMAVDNFTGGYWLVASDGGIFAFQAPFYGSTGAIHLNEPIVGMEADPGGVGYRFVASDGGVFSFNLAFSGSAGGSPLNQPITGMAAEGSGGYWLVARDGGVFTFGGAPYEGSPA